MRGKLIVIGAATFGLLTACQTSRDPGTPSTKEVARDAAQQPLNDVGAVKVKIEPILIEHRDDPYALPDPRTCTAFSQEIAEIDAALGPDFDEPSDEPGKDKKRRDTALRLAGKAGASLLIPFRGVVREVSGAAKREREYQAAIIAGVARRSYLKGRAIQKGC
ncbi:MAG: hypothetical protein AAF205_10190 [Pseudomonadota bacterium]